MKPIKEIIPDSEIPKKAVKTLQFKQAWLNRGFTQVSNKLLRDNSVSLQARFIYILLMSRVFRRDFCFPGQATLGKETSLSDRQIRRLLKELEEHEPEL